MLPNINLICDRKFKIRNFEEDKVATLEANPGLRYDGEGKFSGNFFLTNSAGSLIESFGIIIRLQKSYPNAFPIVFSIDNKIEKTNDFHINSDGEICVEHTYIANKLVNAGLRLYDFINYYLPKYFSWILLKQSGLTEGLQEWAHGEKGTVQVYESLLNTTDKSTIKKFLENYIRASKIGRNNRCYCGSGKKLKHCHYEAALFLKYTSRNNIIEDISFFN